MKVKVYVSDDKKTVNGPVSGIRKVEKKQGGFVITFNDYDHAYRAAKTLINSGYVTVQIL